MKTKPRFEIGQSVKLTSNLSVTLVVDWRIFSGKDEWLYMFKGKSKNYVKKEEELTD